MTNLEKKDIHNRKEAFKKARTKLENDNVIVKQNKELILKFIRDCRLGKTLKNRQKKIIGEARCLKYIHILKKLSFWLNTPFNEVNQDDIERIIENLENDKYIYELKAKNGKVIKSKVLSHSTKLDYKKALIKFYKWLFGNNRNVPVIVEWIDTYDIIKEIPALRREEAEKIATSLNIRDKTIVMFLFDGGPRVEEFLNIRICDLSKTNDVYKARIVYSKTKPRTIHFPIASKYIDLWLDECKSRDSDEYLFQMTYQGLRMMLHRVGKRILKKSITPHLLRHSSATYYANHLNHQQLCYRYGWTMASKMPNRYLDREGIFEKESINVIRNNDLSILEEKNEKLSEEISIVKQTNEYLSRQVEEINEKHNRIFQGKDFMKLLMSLSEKQDAMSKVLESVSGKEFDVVFSS